MTNDKETKTNTKATRTRKQGGNATIQKAKSTDESSKGVQQENKQVAVQLGDKTIPIKEEVDISPYVSNVKGNVYAISGLPEEFIATLFAWVSRSSKSFKEHLKVALKDQDVQTTVDSFKTLDDKAKKFHEKWTVGYGHSSVAEHAVAHVGIEKVSRLASAELELANQFLSITEYSQRYQKPERGSWHNPIKINDSDYTGDPEFSAHQKVEEFYHRAFTSFENLIEGVYTHLKKEFVFSDEYKEIKDDQKKVDQQLNALMKLAFEDARYVLPLAMHTQLGMTANGRAWRDTLAKMDTSDHLESVSLADDLRLEITKVLPVLLKYASSSQYQRNSKNRVKHMLKSSNGSHGRPVGAIPSVSLKTVQNETNLIDEIIALLLVKKEDYTFESALSWAKFSLFSHEKVKMINELLFEMKHFDTPPEEFKHVNYKASFTVSEANWHQLLRHNRKTDFTFSKPSPYMGITIPPRIVQAGLQEIVKDIARQSEELYNELVEQGFETEAEYVVLNAHKRHIYASFDLWEAYHLINLRTSEEAQWDIRETFEELYKQLVTVHPLLMSQAKRRLT